MFALQKSCQLKKNHIWKIRFFFLWNCTFSLLFISNIVWFAFLFSIFIPCFHFQKIRILKTCLVWLLVFCFHEIKILKIYYIFTSCLFVFLDLFKITFIVTAISFYPKWGFYSQLKTLKTRIYFSFSSCFLFSFSLKCFQKFNQTHFYYRFLFSVKMKTENNQTKHPLKFSNTCVDSEESGLRNTIS